MSKRKGSGPNTFSDKEWACGKTAQGRDKYHLLEFALSTLKSSSVEVVFHYSAFH